MRNFAAVLFALLGGCGAQFLNPYFDRPNPWNTTSDRADYLDRKERDWLLELKEPYELPQNSGVAMTLPDLEGWRDTVLVNADVAVLTRMRDQSVQKAAAFEGRALSMAPVNEDSKVQIYGLLWQARVEKLRLRMIEDRLGAVSR
jgi:hypothetical protein